VQAGQLFAQDVDAGLLRMSTKIGVPMAACLAGRRRGGAGVEGAGRDDCRLDEDQLARLRHLGRDPAVYWSDED
jgi:hypothetical protein